MKLESGWYVRQDNDDSTVAICGPFPTAKHAWDNYYADNQLDAKKSDRTKNYMIAKNGQYLMISKAEWIQEDIDNDELFLRFILSPVRIPVFAVLIGEDGLLNC